MERNALFEYKKLLFTEFRMVVVDKEEQPLSNEALQRALTLNSNLSSLGYTFTPREIVGTIATLTHPESVFSEIAAFVPDIKAKPMYPDFPSQVMNMDKAQYRFHQLLHYDSTYGQEFRALITGLVLGVDASNFEVSKGWLPNVEDTEKTAEDDTLLDAKALEVIPTSLMYSFPVQRILSKRERMTVKDTALIQLALELYEGKMSELIPESIPFKENLIILLDSIFALDNTDKQVEALTSVCQHPGDVLKCLDSRLRKLHYHLRRPEKRVWVRTLESYDTVSLKCNLILSNKKAANNIKLLQFIDYNQYSKSPEHKAVIAEFRNGELSSWEGQLKKITDKDVKQGLAFASSHPGSLLRMMSWFLRLGCTVDELESALNAHSDEVSTQTILDLLNKFANEYQLSYVKHGKKTKQSKDIDEMRTMEHNILVEVLEHILVYKLDKFQTPIGVPVEEVEKVVDEDGRETNITRQRPRKVYIDEEMFDLKESKILGNDKSVEGGYLRKGLAIKIPDDVKVLRFFVYWNDKHRVDVDLHAYSRTINGNQMHVGWNGSFKDCGIVMSGDITHSDAAEYIDIDLDEAQKAGIESVFTSIHLFSGKPCFKDIDECFVGCLAVKNTGAEVELYNPKNCFFSHDLMSKVRDIDYGCINPGKRILELRCEENDNSGYGVSQLARPRHEVRFSMRDYIKLLITSQGAQLVDAKADADTILKLTKPEAESEISLIDENFWIDELNK